METPFSPSLPGSENFFLISEKEFENVFDQALFPKKNALLRSEIGPLYTKNERAKLKERRQNYKEIRVQDDNIAENTNARSSLTFRNLLHAEPKDKRKARETFCISQSTVAV